jgi:ankyrin repeat protein
MDPHDGSPILVSAALGELAKVELELARSPGSAKARDENGLTPLHHAAWGGYLEVIEQLLAAGAEVDARDALGRTPLIHMTAWCTRKDVVRLLLGNGAELNAHDDAGNSALYLSASCIRKNGHCWGDHASLAQFLLDSGAAIDIHTTAILGRAEDVSKLADQVNRNDRIGAFDRLGWNVVDRATPLHRAADWGHGDVCSLLLAQGANPAAQDARGRPPFYLAVHEASARKRRPVEEAASVLALVADDDIFTAAISGNVSCVEALLKVSREPVHAQDPGGNTPLMLSLWNGKAEAAMCLLANGAGVRDKNKRGEDAITLAGNVAAGEERDRIVALLLAKGAICDLFSALALRRADLIEACLDADPAALGRPNRRGRSPLRRAAEVSQEFVDFLIARGAFVDIWTAATPTW